MWHHSKITVPDAGKCSTELCMIRLVETPAHHRLREKFAEDTKDIRAPPSESIKRSPTSQGSSQESMNFRVFRDQLSNLVWPK